MAKIRIKACPWSHTETVEEEEGITYHAESWEKCLFSECPWWQDEKCSRVTEGRGT